MTRATQGAVAEGFRLAPLDGLRCLAFLSVYDDIVAHCCHAWNKLIDQPWKIISIGMHDSAHTAIFWL